MPRGAIPEYPPILRGTVEEQMIQLREYIIRNIEAMQRDLTASGGTIYVDNGVAYVTINGSTMTLQEFIENYVSEDGNTINITVNANIENNPDLQDKTSTITANGTQTVTPDEGKDGLSSVEITVNVPQGITPSGTINITNNGTHDVTDYANASVNVQPDLQTKSITIAENGTQTVMPDTGKDGLTSVEITVSVPSSAPNLQSKNATPSGTAQTIEPDTGYDGLSSVIIAAAPLETKIVTPSASQQIITPSSGQYGMSQVTVEGDADLIAGNIKKDIVIFGVTGTYEGGGGGSVNGSLIEITCSSNIDAVTAEINGNTYTAYVDTSAQKAYVTIPHTDTIVARTCTLKGFSNGTQVTSSYVSMAIGIGYYTASLSTSEYLYNRGTWYGVSNPTWTYSNMNPKDRVVQGQNYINFYKGFQYTTTYELDQRFDMHGYKNFEIQYSTSVGDMFRIGSPDGSRVSIQQGSYSTDCYLSTGQSTTGTTDTSTNGTVSFNNAQLVVNLTLDDVDSDDTGVFSILSIKFI